MIVSKTRTFVLFFLGIVSITQLLSDTNIPDQDLQTESTQMAPQETIPLLVEQCRTLAQNFDFLMSLFANLHSAKDAQLMNALTPIIAVCEPIKILPANASNADIYKSFALLSYSTQYLTNLVEKNLEIIDEFKPQLSLKETVTEQDIQEMIETVSTHCNTFLAKIDEAYQDIFGTLLMHVRNQLIKLDKILQAINTNIISNNTLINKEDVRKEIVGLRNTLLQIQKEAAGAHSNPELIVNLLEVTKAVIQHLQDAHKHKFRKWTIVDLAEKLAHRKEPMMLPFDQMLMQAMITNHELDKLEKEAEKIDLTVTNKAARFVGDYIVDPVQKYDLGLYALTTLATLGVGSYAAYYFDQTFSSSPSSRLRKAVGYPDPLSEKLVNIADPKVVIHQVMSALGIDNLEDFKRVIEALPNRSLGAISRSEHLEELERQRILELLLNKQKSKISQPFFPLAKFDEFIYKHRTGAAAIGISLIGLATYCYYRIWKTNHERWAKKINYWFNKLKGGSYAKNAEKFDLIYPNTTFEDIIGLEYEKSLVYPHLKYIKDPERWDANELIPPTGILLTGPTRSGKTFFAKAICGELHKQNPDKNIRFVTIDAHDIKEQGIFYWLGLAKMFAPCVVFIDEIDLLGLQRNQDKTLLADFLQALSGIADKDPKKQVIVIGTTNKPENIDTAMLQSGRLALEIRFKYPNLKERKEFISKRLEKFAIDPNVFEIDIDKLAHETSDKSFEDIKLMLDTAFIHVGIKGQIISQNIFEWALDTQLRRIVDIDTKNISTEEKRMLAAHFAGQALTHLLLNMDEKISKVTIRQIVIKVKEESVYAEYYTQTKQTGLEQGALFTYLDNDTHDIKSMKELAKKAKTLLGARIAERIITNSSSTYFGWKKNSAFNMIKSIVTDGVDIKSLSKKSQDNVSDQTIEKMKEFEQEIEQLLLQHKDTLYALTNELQEKQTLTIDQIVHIITTVEGKAASQDVAPAIAAAA